MTTTSVIPALRAGVMAVIVVGSTTTTPVACAPAARSPKATVAGLRKFVPVMVTGFPPLELPVAGDIPLTVGAGFAGVATGKTHCPTAASILGEMARLID
jgi:hypothetical protein